MSVFRRSIRVILTLSGDSAVWSRWRGKELVDEFIETLPVGLSEAFSTETVASDPGYRSLSAATRCPWVMEAEANNRPLDVHLIVDSAHSEVLRIETAAAHMGEGKSGLGARIQERRLLDRLRQNHPDTLVCRAQGISALKAVWLSREQWPEHWTAWLQGLQSGGVVFIRVSSSLQILARHMPDTARDILYVLIGNHRQQHILVRDGVVVFRRVVAVNGDDSIRTALTDSLNHLQSRLCLVSASLCSLGMSETLCEEWKLHAVIAGDVLIMTDVDEISSDDESANVATHDSQIARMLVRSIVQAPMPKDISATSGPVAEILKTRVVRDQMFRLSFATAISILIASVTVAFATVEGFSSSRESAHRLEEQTRLMLRIADFDEASLSIHPQADTAAQLLRRIEMVEQDQQRSVPALMNLLANVLKEFPAIGLDALQWRTDMADLDQSEPLFVATADSWSPHSDSSVDMDLYTGLETGASLVLEFSGKVDKSRSLRERQERFDALVAALVALETVQRVEVLLSPLAQAASISRNATSGEEPDYQLRVSLHGT